ncbi:bifunctional diaminohydroxyphosphoribosylaminopyrimidine deaminase/5-amino-6-(5-phosphoribosylamino)uracil reductase RibD [Wolbachia endosymbiont of Drosophila mauritiana]|uniref:bifunctional diaminohydroxyphosphoribosylaminopyrimidine deaminase/5-amino-6-(5-phosphoribosylamino)uracil reductase RibD n=1 Tax=unclassified Wolbachia TaxID=2640676 RepID=UPI00107EE0CD|nr:MULTISPECIES: bifunctional diaminohydroxyphosphoribosylaminopyrimidine deaminase/5-amino-6-(5-phosphoribosylamino)uracil reductase RibD [unclassified Wolbachia]QCB63072.1 bifunctional diaminohydroxyphosphoribosylaminopyrimidine deaminase/5-amino-6-(5-phosphoribosylamino)uracil reductase RibD [Wolbachia endosymbiont of Drosophila mauritiana]QCB64117.1 bifunctional diaminohydroxyphosphoribosylaminopyrimidine deaminase/5-amino-6-(5-phosphoribosylamino)uracil reductase RibD [Wolbachia endosymbiont
MTDDYFMSIALKLAEKSLGSVAPNPAVGCVIVKDGMVIGEGYTGIGGRPHAEVVALQNAQDLTHGATMYVTLEPCCHFGVTEPCTAEIIKSGIRKVVIAAIDPDSRVSGGGIKALADAGIEVKQGIMQKEAEKLNVGFFTTKKLHRPFIACKIATTLDGKIATFTGDSKWITSEDTRNWVHELRAKYDAIMIGSSTLINDDPLLTCRLPRLEDRSPIRLIIDSQGKLKKEHNIAKTADKVITWVITNKEVERKIKDINYLIVNTPPVIPVPRHWDPENFKQLRSENWIPVSSTGMTSDRKVCLKDMASKLVSEIGITRLLVEGGGVLVTELLKHDLIDRLIICRSGKILGNDATPFIGDLGIQSINNCYQFKKVEIIDFDEDVVELWDRLL